MSEVIFKVTVDDANIILAGLAELPAKHSITLIQKLQQQAAPQLDMPQPVVVEPHVEVATADTDFAV